jgi:hypothetical protein
LGLLASRSEPLVGNVKYQRWLAREHAAAVAIELTQDLSVPVTMVSIISEDEDLTVAFAEAFWASMNATEQVLLGPDALVDKAAARDATPADLVRAAIAEKASFNPKLHDALRSRLKAEQKEWREAAAKAAALTGWPELEADVANALRSEADPEVRRMLELARAKVSAYQGRAEVIGFRVNELMHARASSFIRRSSRRQARRSGLQTASAAYSARLSSRPAFSSAPSPSPSARACSPLNEGRMAMRPSLCAAINSRSRRGR